MTFNRFKSVAVLAVMVALVGVMSASAAELQLVLQYAGSFDSGFNPAAYSLADGVGVPAGTVQATDIHQFDIYYTMDPSAPPTPTGGVPADGQVAQNSLQQLILDVVLGTGLTQEATVPYSANPDPQAYDPAPAGAAGGASRALYTENSDATGNLTRIIGTTDALAAFGRNPGEAAPSLLGSFYLNWDGVTPTSLSLTPAASAPVDPWLLHTNGWIDTLTPFTHSAGTGYVPATGTMHASVNSAGPTTNFDLLLVTGGPTVVDASYDLAVPPYQPLDFTHQFTATGGTTPYAWSDLTLVSSPAGGVIPNAATMGADGMFEWNRRGASAGDYQWSVLCTGGGTDTGFLTIHVPEPSSIALFGLAIVGLVGFVRRR
jgi:hypothetical protein